MSLSSDKSKVASDESSSEVRSIDQIEQPANWSRLRKWSIVVSATLITFMVSFASSVYSAVSGTIASEFNVSPQVSILGVVLYVAAFALGPMIWGPASELFGRTRPLFLGYAMFLIFQIPFSVAMNIETILISRFFAALFGSSTLAIVGGMMVDFLGPIERGISTGVYSIGVFCGPVLGPVFGTLINESLGWRWTGWLTLIFGAFLGAVCVMCTRESSPHTLRRRHARKFGLPCDEHQPEIRMFAEKYLTKPIRMLFSEPILMIFTAYMSLVYGILYLSLTMYPYAFIAERGLDARTASLPFLFLLTGIVIACVIITIHSVHIRKRQAAGRPFCPEDRLGPVVFGSLLLTAGLLWFAYTSDASRFHWLVQASSGILIGCGIILVFMLSNLFLIETYLASANSALAANILVRSGIAAAFPILSQSMFNSLGVTGTVSMLGYICLGLAPFPPLMIVYGQRIRAWSKFAQG